MLARQTPFSTSLQTEVLWHNLLPQMVGLPVPWCTCCWMRGIPRSRKSQKCRRRHPWQWVCWTLRTSAEIIKQTHSIGCFQEKPLKKVFSIFARLPSFPTCDICWNPASRRRVTKPSVVPNASLQTAEVLPPQVLRCSLIGPCSWRCQQISNGWYLMVLNIHCDGGVHSVCVNINKYIYIYYTYHIHTQIFRYIGMHPGVLHMPMSPYMLLSIFRHVFFARKCWKLWLCYSYGFGTRAMYGHICPQMAI